MEKIQCIKIKSHPRISTARTGLNRTGNWAWNADLLLQEQYRHQTGTHGWQIWCLSDVQPSQGLRGSGTDTTLRSELELDSERVLKVVRLLQELYWHKIGARGGLTVTQKMWNLSNNFGTQLRMQRFRQNSNRTPKASSTAIVNSGGSDESMTSATARLTSADVSNRRRRLGLEWVDDVNNVCQLSGSDPDEANLGLT